MADEKTPAVTFSEKVAPTSTTPRQPRPLPPLDLPILQTLRSIRTILASSSPRRRQLLSQLTLPNLEILPSDHPEDLPKSSFTTPWDYCLATASAKCLGTYRIALSDGKGDPGVVIAADTIVVGYNGEILEKPRSERQHVEMLMALRDGGRAVGKGEAERRMVEAAARQVENMGLGGGMRGESAVGKPVTAPSGGPKRGNVGGWHKVYTAIAVAAPLESARDPGYVLETSVEETGVRFASDGMWYFFF
jgi:septum formation protein